jgi:hypothetical protein
LESDDLGRLRRLKINFRNLAGDDTDPSEVTLVVRDPDDAETTRTFGASQVQKTDAGDFYFDWLNAKPGLHVAYWKGTGALVAAASEEWWVLRPGVVAA